MKSFPRILIIILAIISIGILFRGPIYRSLITYKATGDRHTYAATNKEFIDFIDKAAIAIDTQNVNNIIDAGLSITSKHLSYSLRTNEIDPNHLIESPTAHCVGYATFLASTINHLLKIYNLDKEWIATPKIGQLYLFGSNLHDYFDSSFFKDHDFVLIENNNTGEAFAVDPTVHDYLRIDYVRHE